MATTYQHYEPPPDCIRFVPEVDNALRCEILIVPFEEAPPYKALSYVWGDSSVTEELQCNGKSFMITTNLSLALHQLASSADMVLWIDQLCIDQKNVAERSQQVNMMGRIFSRAEQAIMCLGPDLNNYAPRVVPFFQELLQSRMRPLSHGTAISDGRLLEDGLPELSSIKWTALRDLLQVPYFERVWIIQEVMLGSSKFILWGSKELLWEDLVAVLTWLSFMASWLARQFTPYRRRVSWKIEPRYSASDRYYWG